MIAHGEVVRASRTWSMLCHLSVFANFVLPFGGLIAAFAIYTSRRGDVPFARDQQRRALNFEITLALANACFLIAILFTFFTVALSADHLSADAAPSAFISQMLPVYVAMTAFYLAMLGACVIACFGAYGAWFGLPFRYPVAIPFVRPPRRSQAPGA